MLINEIPQLETKHQLKTVVPKLTKLESLAKNNINQYLYSKDSSYFNSSKISSAEFHIDEKKSYIFLPGK